jgi:hypothetical protein
MFDRIVSIDWSGAAHETKAVDLRVAEFDTQGQKPVLVDPPNHRPGQRGWSRSVCRSWLVEQLERNRPTVVAMDFGFGLPWGADRALFEVTGWRQLLRKLGQLYNHHRTARATAVALNAQARFNGHGPYRFDDSRSDFRFYLDNEVPYYRLTETLAPQAISQWYLGSGGTVGFHTITGLATLDHLISLREERKLEFEIWPHETLHPDGRRHVLVESYPALYPPPDDYGPCIDPHQRDAWRVLHYLVEMKRKGRLPELFDVKPMPIGRALAVDFIDQIQFEGYIVGLH